MPIFIDTAQCRSHNTRARLKTVMVFFGHLFARFDNWGNVTVWLSARCQTFREYSSSSRTSLSPQRHHKPLLATPNRLRDFSSGLKLLRERVILSFKTFDNLLLYLSLKVGVNFMKSQHLRLKWHLRSLINTGADSLHQRKNGRLNMRSVYICSTSFFLW